MIECTIGDLQEFNALNDGIVFKGGFTVETPEGMKQIQGVEITSYNSEMMETTTSSNKSLITSPDHLLYTEDWVKVKMLSIGDKISTKNGIETIENLRLLDGRDDLLDLQVEGGQYYTNGILSHNSTLVDVLYYNLFGKSFRGEKLSGIVNNRNKKNLRTETLMESGGKEYKIVRSIKPNSFEIWEKTPDSKKFEMIDQDSKTKDYQKFLEEDILRLDAEIFEQLCVKSMTKFDSFFELKKDKKREIIETIFDLEIIPAWKEENKSDIREHKETILVAENSVNRYEVLIDQEITNIERLKVLKNKESIDKKQEIKNREKEIETIRPEIEKYEKGMKIITRKESELVEIKKEQQVHIVDREQLLKDMMTTQKKTLGLHDKDISNARNDQQNAIEVLNEEVSGIHRSHKNYVSEEKKKMVVVHESIRKLKSRITTGEKFQTKVNNQSEIFNGKLDFLRESCPTCLRPDELVINFEEDVKSILESIDSKISAKYLKDTSITSIPVLLEKVDTNIKKLEKEIGSFEKQLSDIDDEMIESEKECDKRLDVVAIQIKDTTEKANKQIKKLEKEKQDLVSLFEENITQFKSEPLPEVEELQIQIDKLEKMIVKKYSITEKLTNFNKSITRLEVEIDKYKKKKS
ncbi:MAG: hypothetical protein GY870_14150, partial [archaeon]|nr:hypothetical protein [archaeon]